MNNQSQWCVGGKIGAPFHDELFDPGIEVAFAKRRWIDIVEELPDSATRISMIRWSCGMASPAEDGLILASLHCLRGQMAGRRVLLAADDVCQQHRQSLGGCRMREEGVAQHGEGQVTEHRRLHRRHQLARFCAEC